MLIYLISKNCSDQLGDACKEQVGMKRFLILGFMPGFAAAWEGMEP